MDFREDQANQMFIRSIKKDALSDKEALSMVEDFCRYIAQKMLAITKGCALADVYMNERKNIIMSNVDLERILAHFEVMDTVFEKVNGENPKLAKLAAEAMDRGSDFYLGFRNFERENKKYRK